MFFGECTCGQCSQHPSEQKRSSRCFRAEILLLLVNALQIRRFQPIKVKEMIHEILHSRLEGQKYHVDKVSVPQAFDISILCILLELCCNLSSSWSANVRLGGQSGNVDFVKLPACNRI